MALRTLYQSFLHSDIERLRIIARQWKLEPVAVRHTDLAAELVDTMVDADAIMTVLSGLPDSHKAALDDLLRHDNMIPWPSFIRRWGSMREIGMGKMEREELWREPYSASEALWLLGLVQRDYSEHPSDPIEMAYIPEELSLYMPVPDLLDIPPPQTTAFTYEKPHVDVNDDLAEDLVTWWVAIQRGQLSDTTPKSAGSISNQLLTPTDMCALLLKTLSLEQGWVRIDQDQNLRLVPDAILSWLRADLWMQWSSIAQAWMLSAEWHDLAYVQSLHPDPVSDWLPNPLQTRQSIIDALRRCAIGEWYYVNEFTEYIKKYTTDFMRPDGNYERWAPRDANSDHPLRGYESWEYVEGAYIRFVISGPLVWLGILELHSSGIDTVADDVFRLTTAGGALLELCDPPLFKIPPRIAILSGGLIDVPSRRRYERYQLSRIAQFAQPGNIVRFRVTPSSLNRALQQRITLARIVNFLEQATERPLPPYLKTAIENHYRDNKGASLEHLWVLRLPDPEHKAVSALQNFIQEQLTPNIVTIAERDLDRVIAILSENGLLTDIREV